MNCSNCNAKMSCGCQKRRASDGTSCCSGCLAFYEKKLKAEKEMKTINPPNNTWGANRYTENK
jgi:hypothetical protein